VAARCRQKGRGAHACFAPGKGYCMIRRWHPRHRWWTLRCVLRDNGGWMELPIGFARNLRRARKAAREALAAR